MPGLVHLFAQTSNIDLLTKVFGYAIYGLLGIVALWGFFCVMMVWMRVVQTRFRSEPAQDEFLAGIGEPLSKGNLGAVASECQEDDRALPQLVLLAIESRTQGFAKVRQLLLDRFQRDVLSDLDHRLSWVYTVIKTAPMIGLLGTVIGMMGAFGKLSAAESVDPSVLAEDIMLALITTACGLAIAIPLVLCAASINVRIRKMEELTAAGMTQFLDMFRAALFVQPPK